MPSALIGGALIGMASGCVAASVAASRARRRERRAQQLRDAAAAPSIKPPPVAATPPGPPPFTGTLEAGTSPNGQALVRATFELPTASVVLNAAPSSDPDHVWLRIRDTSSSSVPQVCTLHLSADGESHIANESHVEVQNGEATLRGNVALSFLAAMVTADHASLHACGKAWPLSAVSKAFLGRFVERVGELIPPPETPDPSPQLRPEPAEAQPAEPGP